MGILDHKCRFWERCEWYDKKSPSCNKDGGKYHLDQTAGCFAEMEKREEQERKNKKPRSIKELQPFTKYLLVGIAVTILSIFFSWLFIDVIGLKAFWVLGVLAIAIFLFKYHSYTQINLIHKKFIIFIIIEISSLVASVIIGGVFIDILSFPTLIIVPLSIGVLFLLRFAALHWTGIIRH